MTDAQHSADTGGRSRTGRGGEPDHRARHAGDAVLAPVAGRPAEWDAADAGHRAGVHARGVDQRDEFCDPVSVTGRVSALDGSQDFPSGDDQFVPDRDVRVDLRGGQLHDEQHGDDRQHDRDRGKPDDPGARGRGDGDHLCDDTCDCGGHDDAIQPGRVVRATRVIRPGIFMVPEFRAESIMRRTCKSEDLNRIGNDPSVRPWLGGDVPADFSTALDNIDNIALVSEYGGFVFFNHGAGRYEGHALFSPSRPSQSAVHAMRDALVYMFTSTPCVELITKVPIDNRATHGLARLAGFQKRFDGTCNWSRDVEKQIGFYGLSLEAWALRSRDALRMGQWFHTALETLKTATQSPAHPEDGVHDHILGATIEMLRSGLPWKAVFFYNQWASWAGYEAIDVLSEKPLVVEFDHMRIEIMSNRIEVL
jgi:hypothetical protein